MPYQTKLGNADINVTTGEVHPHLAQMRQQRHPLLNTAPRLVYLWDCALEPDGNARGVPSVTVEADIVFARLSPTGQPQSGEAGRHASRWAKRTGARNAADLQRHVDALFRPATFKVPYAFFARLLNARNKVLIFMWVEYRAVAISPVNAAQPDYALILRPLSARFVAVPMGVCVEQQDPPGDLTAFVSNSNSDDVRLLTAASVDLFELMGQNPVRIRRHYSDIERQHERWREEDIGRLKKRYAPLF